jgi:hypothetical protein
MKLSTIIAWAIALSIAVSVFYSIPVWFLWNWLMPEVFGLPKISFVQAFGICILSTLLFKSSIPPSKG